MQLKKDTIEKHYWKIYIQVKDKDENIKKERKERDSSTCAHKRYYDEWLEFQKQKKALEEIGGTITAQFEKWLNTILVSKILQFFVIFTILKKGKPMIDFIDYKILFMLTNVQNLPSAHWLDRSG